MPSSDSALFSQITRHKVVILRHNWQIKRASSSVSPAVGGPITQEVGNAQVQAYIVHSSGTQH